MRRAVIVLTAAVSALFILFSLGAPTASALAKESVRGTIKNQGQPVAGVRIDVADTAGQSIGNATTNAQGTWEVKLPKPGTYRVTLQGNTLPQGVGFRVAGDKGVRTVRVHEGQTRTVLFAMGKRVIKGGGEVSDNKLEKVPQLLFDGLNLGLVIALAALGLSLVFGTTGLTNFSHGELVTLGALFAWYFNSVGIPLYLAIALSVAASGAYGYLQDTFIWARLRKRKSGIIAMMICTIGFAIAMRYVFLYLFGGRTRAYDEYSSQEGWDFLKISAPPKVLLGMAFATAVLVGVGLGLLYTRIGKATRAVADNPNLAATSGINVELVIRLVWIAGTALAGLGGAMFSLSFGVNYQMGFATLLLVFAGTILGGLGTAFGALVGSLVVGLFIQLSTLWVPAETKNAGALLVLIVVLLFRPQGILGRRERVG